MNYLICLIVFTSNILGSFNDPFEFEGDYGEEINPIREYVFEQVVTKESLVSHLTQLQLEQLMAQEQKNEDILKYHQRLIRQAVQEDLQHGPTLSELVPNSLIEQLLLKQHALKLDGFSEQDINNFIYFISRYGDQKAFAFFRHAPSELLSLDKILRDKASRQGAHFDLPILSSMQPLVGNNAYELKAHLLESLFSPDTLAIVKPQDQLDIIVKQLDPHFLQDYLGDNASADDLKIFTTPAGQVFFYWLYQSLNLHLTAQNTTDITHINHVKETFFKTLGNPTARAQIFRDRLLEANASVVFTQESDTVVPQLLTENGLFHSVEAQNSADGTWVFLQGSFWEAHYQVVSIEDYEGFIKGRLNVILATTKETGEKFLLASAHGNSTRAEDGRLQITKIVEKYHQLARLPENNQLQLIIGIDANTKSREDIECLQQHLETLGLVSTHAGPTTIKKRMVTAQHSKAGRFAIDEEDYILILKQENGGLYQIEETSVGFKNEKPDPKVTLPNKNNPSDHYPVGVKLTPFYNPRINSY